MIPKVLCHLPVLDAKGRGLPMGTDFAPGDVKPSAVCWQLKLGDLLVLYARLLEGNGSGKEKKQTLIRVWNLKSMFSICRNI